MGYCFAKGLDSYILASRKVLFGDELLEKYSEIVNKKQMIYLDIQFFFFFLNYSFFLL
jgi:hypothetical protein